MDCMARYCLLELVKLLQLLQTGLAERSQASLVVAWHRHLVGTKIDGPQGDLWTTSGRYAPSDISRSVHGPAKVA